MLKIKRSYATLLLVLVVLALFFTRFWNISWGLPYPFHPDERNMAIAAQQLSCPNVLDIKNCLNPRFFAYGQPPLYLAYVLAHFSNLLSGKVFDTLKVEEVSLALRIISAVFSIGVAWILFRSLKNLGQSKNKIFLFFSSLLFVFSPALIQLSHFGTTESMLMFFYISLTFMSLLLIESKISMKKYILLSSFVLGLSIATKVSSLIFAFLPLFTIINLWKKDKKMKERIVEILQLGFLSFIICLIFSPQSLISFNDFMGAIKYESSVAQGVSVFYTRSFVDSIPVLYQFAHVFPYSLGLPVLLLFLFAFIFLPWTRKINLIRVSFLIYFLPTAFLYAKWSRFVAPVFPTMLLLAALFIHYLYQRLRSSHFLVYIVILLSIIPGVAFMSIYMKPDVRQEASDWISHNVPQDSFILSETANVVDIPITLGSEGRAYVVDSFDFYHLDEDTSLQADLAKTVERADYILIPSRRIYKNHTCLDTDTTFEDDSEHCRNLQKEYPVLNKYYRDLFSGKLGFTKEKEFSSFPQLSLFGKSVVFPDENAEETWTVFDHPVVRIYRRYK